MEHFAKYYKCALQVNPYSYSSFRGEAQQEEAAYNEEILNICRKVGIEVVGLANHGNVDSSESLRQKLRENGITVFPGFEIMTAEKIHIVCLFPEDKSLSELNRYIGALGLSSSTVGNETSTFTCLDIAKKVKDCGGFWYAAHITSDNGVLKLGKMQNVWKSEHLVAAQIPDSKENIDPKYKNIIANKDPEYKRDRPVALINACDIDKPEDLEKDSAATLIKLTKPSFENFVMAFKDPESRIRLQSELEPTYRSHIKQITVYGGYLDGLDISFSEHLNSIIGGRGTGKSTIINLIRYAMHLEPKDKDRRKEFDSMIENNLGSNSRVELIISSYSQHGKQYRIIRRYKTEPVVEDEKGNVVTLSVSDLLPTIEIYGQNEIIDAVKDQSLIYGIVKRLFVFNKNIEQKINDAYEQLRKNSKSISDLTDEFDKDEGKTSDLPALRERYRFYEEAGLKEKLPVLTRLASEEASYHQFDEQMKQLTAPEFPQMVLEVGDNPETQKLNVIAEAFNKKMLEAQSSFDQAVSQLKEGYTHAMASWSAERSKYDDEIRAALKELDGIQDKSGSEIATEYTDLIRKIQTAEPIQKRNDERKKAIDRLIGERRTLIEACRKALDEHTEDMNRQLKKLNKKFGNSIRLSIEYHQRKDQLLSVLMQINQIAEKSLLGLIQYKDFDIFSFVEDVESGADRLKTKYALTAGVADKIVNYLNDAKLRAIEELQLEDIFQIELSVNGQFRKLENLSKGQQCTAILNILLVDNKDPLIIDQPEDNLDNAYITDSLISSIRENKIKRQYLFATHNANIPVFGDAELIVSMIEEDGSGRVSQGGEGSIDVASVKERVINILEGGRAAFQMREQKYGL